LCRKLLIEVSQGAKETRRLVQELIQQIRQDGPQAEGISFLDLKNRLLLRWKWIIKMIEKTSVADLWCLSRILDPGSWFWPIPDPGSKNSKKREGWKKICCHNFICSHKFHKIANYFSFEVLKKKIWVNFQRIIELFSQKIVNKLSKIWVWDPRSGIRKKPMPDPGSRIQGSKRHRIPDPRSGSATLEKTVVYYEIKSFRYMLFTLEVGSINFVLKLRGLVASWTYFNPF
jgi:hypothetical protein